MGNKVQARGTGTHYILAGSSWHFALVPIEPHYRSDMRKPVPHFWPQSQSESGRQVRSHVLELHAYSPTPPVAILLSQLRPCLPFKFPPSVSQGGIASDCASFLAFHHSLLHLSFSPTPKLLFYSPLSRTLKFPSFAFGSSLATSSLAGRRRDVCYSRPYRRRFID